MDLSGAVGLDESPSDPSPSDPSPSPSQLPGPRNPRPLFYGGSPSEEETEEDSLTGEAGDAGSSTGDPWTEAESEFLDDDEPTSSTGSPAGDKPAQLLSKHQLRLTARAAVKTATGVTHTVAAKTPEAQRVGLYLADEDDQKAIGDPLADIAYRRGDVVGGKLSPDANDLLRSMMGVGNYFAKQVALLGEVRRLQAGAAAGEVQHLPTPDVA
jgi:hypothetical protein